MQVTREEAMRGLVDFSRIEEMLARIGNRIDLCRTPHVTPLAAPLFLEAGKVRIDGAAEERLLAEESARVMAEAGLSEPQ
jgi:ATP-dependent Lhr-like helicase